jgi:hypothetical protein
MGVRQRPASSNDGVVFEEGSGLAWLCRVSADRYIASVHGVVSEELVRAQLRWVDDQFGEGLRWCASDLSEVRALGARAAEVASEWAQRRATMPVMLILFRTKLTEMSLSLYQLVTRHPLEVFSDPARFEEAVRRELPMYRRRSLTDFKAKG